jgi:hypothetical protein
MRLIRVAHSASGTVGWASSVAARVLSVETMGRARLTLDPATSATVGTALLRFGS